MPPSTAGDYGYVHSALPVEMTGEDVANEEMFEVGDDITSKSLESFIFTYYRINFVYYIKFTQAWNQFELKKRRGTMVPVFISIQEIQGIH